MDTEGTLRAIHQRQVRPLVALCETWQDEAGISASVWTVTDPATGTAWARGASGAYLRASAAPNASETARLRSNQRWMCGPGVFGDNTVLRQMMLEFEMKLTTVANMDNSLCAFGLTSDVGDDRSSNNLIAFALTGDALQSVTDNAGTETTNTGFGETLTNWNLLGIRVYRGGVKFLLNGAVVATHTSNLPDAPLYLNYFVDTEAGGAAAIDLGIVRVYPDDSRRF